MWVIYFLHGMTASYVNDKTLWTLCECVHGMGMAYAMGCLTVCETFKYSPIESEDIGVFTTKMVSHCSKNSHFFDH